jgi:hypothetical protein
MSPLTLFESEPQYREKATIWRVFSLLPLYGPLAEGHIFRWFAINIPMDLGTGGKSMSDIDILARLHDFPRSREWVYRTWEVKVSLLCKDGTARSIKLGKMDRILKQLRAYRKFGSPDVSLLDIYICEAGFMNHNVFPPSSLISSISTKMAELHRDRFGYQLLPFKHGKNGDVNVGLLAIGKKWDLTQTTFKLLPAVTSPPRQPFSRLANHLDEFFEHTSNKPNKPFNQIVFCKECRELQLIRMRDKHTCPNCRADLVL